MSQLKTTKMTELGKKSGSGQNDDQPLLTKSEEYKLDFNFKVYYYKIEDHFARKCYQSVLAH